MTCSLIQSLHHSGVINRLGHKIIGAGLDFLLHTQDGFINIFHVGVKGRPHHEACALLQRFAGEGDAFIQLFGHADQFEGI
ncbi:hypothetical protein D3C75_956280 [compost metagenome]